MTDKADGKKDKIRSTRIKFVAEYETDGSMKFITGEDLELLVSWQIKGTVRPEKLEFDEAVTFYKVRTGEIFTS